MPHGTFKKDECQRERDGGSQMPGANPLRKHIGRDSEK